MRKKLVYSLQQREKEPVKPAGDRTLATLLVSYVLPTPKTIGVGQNKGWEA